MRGFIHLEYETFLLIIKISKLKVSINYHEYSHEHLKKRHYRAAYLVYDLEILLSYSV
jgi:hypothetical protein